MVTVAPSVATSLPSNRTCRGVVLKPEPKIFTGPTAFGAAPRVIFAAGLKFAGVGTVESSIAGVSTRSMWTGLMVPSLKPVSVPLPEFSVRTRLLIGSTAMAPKMVTLGVGLVEVQLKDAPAAVKQARPLWPVVTMAGRSEMEDRKSTRLNSSHGYI